MITERIENGAKFTIDLKHKYAKVGNKVIVEKGVGANGYTVIEDENPSWEKVEELYRAYKYSIPHERENRSYFKALSSDELTDEQMVLGQDRNVAQFNLEIYLLVNGNKLNMDEPTHWFWQSETEKDLVVLKEWL